MLFTEPGSFNLVSNIAQTSFNVSSSGITYDRLGAVTLSLSKDYSTSGQTQAGGTGAFIDGLQKSMSNAYVPTEAQLELDTCRVSSYSITASDIDLPNLLDAGSALQISSPTKTYSLKKKSESIPQLGKSMIYYSAVSITPAAYIDGAVYSFSGPGGPDVGSFSTSVTAPPKIKLLNPDLSASPVVINSAQDLNLTWSNPDNTGEVWISIISTELNMQTYSSTTYSCDCRFKDDGSGTIPANKLQQLPKGGGGMFSQLPTMSASRVNLNTFQATGIEQGVAAIMNGETAEVRLQ